MSEKSDGMEQRARTLLIALEHLPVASHLFQEEVCGVAIRFLNQFLADQASAPRTPTPSQTDVPKSDACELRVSCQNLTGTLVLECSHSVKTASVRLTSGAVEISQDTPKSRQAVNWSEYTVPRPGQHFVPALKT